MKPQEFIDKWLGWAKNKEEINVEILADLDVMNQALRIHDVVGRSEHFYCVSSGALVYGKPCEKWCGDENCKALCKQ